MCFQGYDFLCVSLCEWKDGLFVALLHVSRSWVHSSGLGMGTELWLVRGRARSWKSSLFLLKGQEGYLSPVK